MTSLDSIFTPKAIAALTAAGLFDGEGNAPAALAAAPISKPSPRPVPTLQSLSTQQKEIYEALTYRPLNQNQTALLWIYLSALYADEGAIWIDEAAARLAKMFGYSPGESEEYVKGGLRAFGKRLDKKLKKLFVKHGKDKHGEDVADKLPLLALLRIEKTATGTRHHLTKDGEIVATLLLSMSDLGLPDAVPAEPMVLVEIKASTHLALAKAKDELGLSLDETLLHLAGLAGIKVQ